MLDADAAFSLETVQDLGGGQSAIAVAVADSRACRRSAPRRWTRWKVCRPPRFWTVSQAFADPAAPATVFLRQASTGASAPKPGTCSAWSVMVAPWCRGPLTGWRRRPRTAAFHGRGHLQCRAFDTSQGMKKPARAHLANTSSFAIRYRAVRPSLGMMVAPPAFWPARPRPDNARRDIRVSCARVPFGELTFPHRGSGFVV